MSRRLIVVLVVAVIISVMVGSTIFEVFDVHDTKPFPIDPEFLLLILSTVMMLCAGVLIRTVQLFISYLWTSERLSVEHLGLQRARSQRRDVLELERLLFSPPLSVTSLRV